MVGGSVPGASCKELDADPNIPDTLGIRPLTYAAGNGHEEVPLKTHRPLSSSFLGLPYLGF